MTTSKLLIRSNTNPPNPLNVRSVAVIFLPFQVNCEFLNFHDHFYLAKFAFFREDILFCVYKGWAQSAYFCEMLPVPRAINPVPKLYRPKNLITKYEYLPTLYFWLINCRLIDTVLDPNSNKIYSQYAFY